jgi:hypothetical protein
VSSTELSRPSSPPEVPSHEASALDVTTPGFGGSTPSGNSPLDERFKYVVAPQESADAALLGTISPRFRTLPSGTRVEVSANAYRLAGAVGRLISPSNNGDHKRVDAGAALVIDYGADRAASDSFRVSINRKWSRTLD